MLVRVGLVCRQNHTRRLSLEHLSRRLSLACLSSLCFSPPPPRKEEEPMNATPLSFLPPPLCHTDEREMTQSFDERHRSKTPRLHRASLPVPSSLLPPSLLPPFLPNYPRRRPLDEQTKQSSEPRKMSSTSAITSAVEGTASVASSALARSSDSAGAAKATGQTEGEVPQAEAPKSLRDMVACRRCYLVKSFEQFLDDGCENCQFLKMKDKPERCEECTTKSYQGLVAMMRPKTSWVAKWQGLHNFCSGAYAMRVNVELSEKDKENLRDKKVPMFEEED